MPNIEYLVGDQVQTLDGLSSRDIDAALANLGYGDFLVNYSTPGTYKFICPSTGVVSNFKVFGIGAGGDGDMVNAENTPGGGGGGGGASSHAALTLVPGQEYEIIVPAHGSKHTPTGGAALFRNINTNTVLMRAIGGDNAAGSVPGVGGATSFCVGDTKFAGGDGYGGDGSQEESIAGIPGAGGGAAGGGSAGDDATSPGYPGPAVKGAGGIAGSVPYNVAGGAGGGPGGDDAATPGGGGSGIVDEGNAVGGDGFLRISYTRR